MNHDEYYKQVYSQDNPDDVPHGWIQWKGTDVCIDLHCECGHHGHFDGYFLYAYRCRKCGASYALGQNVKLIKLTPEQIAHAEQHDRFKSDEPGPFDDDFVQEDMADD